MRGFFLSPVVPRKPPFPLAPQHGRFPPPARSFLFLRVPPLRVLVAGLAFTASLFFFFLRGLFLVSLAERESLGEGCFYCTTTIDSRPRSHHVEDTVWCRLGSLSFPLGSPVPLFTFFYLSLWGLRESLREGCSFFLFAITDCYLYFTEVLCSVSSAFSCTNKPSSVSA